MSQETLPLAQRALWDYRGKHDQRSDEEAATDLIADLLLLLDRNGFDANAVHARALLHFEDEATF